jgi:8-oxo-dGTP diphosphatase
LSPRPDPAHQLSTPLRIRPAARAVVLTPTHHVLLVRFEFPTGTRWALPGGGIHADETPVDALRRELHEEVGLVGVDIGPHIWNREHRIPFVDGLWDGQREQIHLVPVRETFEPVPALDWETLNGEFLHELRWWHIDDIGRASHLTFVPAALHRHLVSLLECGPPEHPITVEV